MADFFGQSLANDQPPGTDYQQGDYMTRDELFQYVRSDAFRSVMRNQNADLYEVGQWSDFGSFDLLTTSSPYTTFASAPIGTSGAKRARYTQIGNTVIYTFTVKFGSDFTPQSGLVYCINMPVAPASPSAFNNNPNWYIDNNHQTFCGTVYVYGGNSLDFEGPIGWIHPSIKVDRSTGNAYQPGRIFFVYGANALSTTGGNEFWNDQYFFGPGDYTPPGGSAGSNTFPTSNAVITGLITYESANSSTSNAGVQ